MSMMIPASLRTYPVYDLQPRTRYEFRLIATIDRSDSVPSPIAAVNTTAPGDPPGTSLCMCCCVNVNECGTSMCKHMCTVYHACSRVHLLIK